MKYTKVTEKNFEEFTNKHVSRNGGDLRLIDIEMPTNEKKFKQITKALYGVQLGVDCMAYPLGSFSNYKYACKYEITGIEQQEYSQNPIMKLWEKKYSQYDGLKPLLNSCFGVLFCGGVATYHYGQTKCDKGTWERVKNWDNNNQIKVLKNLIDQRQSLNEIFDGRSL